jgi:rhodanese-related sulfurtransferase
MKRYIIITIGLFFLTSGCERVQNYNSANELVMDALKVVKLITVKELKNLMESEEIYTLIDVRQKSEHYYGYIPGSLIIPRGSLEFLIENANFWEEEGLYQPEKNEKIIVYCKKGNRCILAAESLNKLGFSEVYALKEGWKGWELTYPEEVEKNLEMLNGNNHEEHVDTGGC